MFCQKCGTELSPDANFCPSCGNPVTGQQLYPASGPKKSYKKAVIISVISILVIAAGVVLALLLSKGGIKGYDTLEEAAAADIIHLNEHDWNSILDSVSSDDWKMFYENYKPTLNKKGIKSADALKDRAKKDFDAITWLTSIHSVTLAKDEDTGSTFEYDFSSDNTIFSSKKHLGSALISYSSNDEENALDRLVYYKEGDKWYSAIGLVFAHEVIRYIIRN